MVRTGNIQWLAVLDQKYLGWVGAGSPSIKFFGNVKGGLVNLLSLISS